MLPVIRTKIEGFSSSASLSGYGATTIQYVNPRHGGENLTIDGSVTWPEPSGVGMVRGATAFGSTPASWAEAPVEDATMSAHIEKIKCRSRTA